jgi:hypothetical protein
MLTLRLKRRSDGGSAFTLVRVDGSAAWQRQDRHAAFFAHHDLVHLAVEQSVPLRRAFYALVASGWGFDDFLAPYPRGPLPAEALWAETLVGMLEVERAQAAHGAPPMMAGEINAHIASKFGADDRTVPHELRESELREIRRRRDALFAQWHATPPGETLELIFEPNHAP